MWQLWVRDEKCIQGFDGGELKESDHLEDVGVAGRRLM
jgi:hypothetical protein